MLKQSPVLRHVDSSHFKRQIATFF
uniref:Uncharacterized protein n=1 Tax=Musa acuminata subsp. malaccensis TaxID=214687 RepID=A0A804J155_MUSAM